MGGRRHRHRQWQRNRDRERLRETNVGRNTESCLMWCGCEDTRVSIIIPVTGVRRVCEPPAVGDGKWSPALWKRGRHLYYWATSPDPNRISICKYNPPLLHAPFCLVWLLFYFYIIWFYSKASVQIIKLPPFFFFLSLPVEVLAHFSCLSWY